MKELELKHLAGYLPYGLKGISTEENLGIEIVKGFSTYGKNDTINMITNVDDIDLIMFKPILYPLSDLTKEIEVNGEKFVPKEVLDETHVSNWSYGNIKNVNTEMLQEAPFWWTTKLYEWHFDIHGLIEKGLAIDINTLNK